MPNLDFEVREDSHIIAHHQKTNIYRQTHVFASTENIFRHVKYSDTQMTATVPMYSVASKRAIFLTVSDEANTIGKRSYAKYLTLQNSQATPEILYSPQSTIWKPMNTTLE